MKTITQLVVQSVNKKYDNYYVDTYDSYTEVGITSKEGFSSFLSELEERNIDYQVQEKNTVEVYN